MRMSPEMAAAAILAGIPQGELSRTEFKCGACFRAAELEPEGMPGNVERLGALLEHTMFEHSMREDILVERTAVLLTGYETAKMLDLPVLTVAEERWREDHE